MAGSQPSTPGGGKRIETGVDPRLFVSLRLNGKGVRALVDTGAARTLMDLALWKSIYEDTRPPYCRSTVQLQGITGQQTDTVGLVDVSVCGRIIPVYLVRTIDPTMFILGYDSLCILDATIDAASNHVTINAGKGREDSPTTMAEIIPLEEMEVFLYGLPYYPHPGMCAVYYIKLLTIGF